MLRPALHRMGTALRRRPGRRFVLLLLLGPLLPVGCGEGAEDGTHRRAAPSPEERVVRLRGCYDLELGAWSPVRPDGEVPVSLRTPPPDARGDSLLFAPPPRVRLAAVPAARPSVEAGSPVYELRVAPGAIGSVHEMRTWRPAAGDSVRLVLSTGFAGLELRLRGGEDELRGTAETFTDVGGVQQYATSARLSRVPCDAPLPEAARTQREFPRKVTLEGGDVLRLGAPLPGAFRRAAARPGGVRDTVIRAAVAGVFAGAEEIEAVMIRGDTVASLRLHYRRSAVLDSVLARMRRELGLPTTESPAPLRTYRWANRSVSVYVTPHGAGGGWAGTVTLLDPRRG